MAENSDNNSRPSETVGGIRDVYESYKSLYLINPKQDPGFLIQHLENVFDNDESIVVKLEDGGHDNNKDSQTVILGRIRTVYNVYKTLCKYNLNGAPGILIQNLKEILSKEEEPKVSDVNKEFLPQEEESDLNIKIVMTQSLQIEDAPQFEANGEDFAQEQNHNFLLHKPESRDSFNCTFCKKSFPYINLRNIHEGSCSECPALKPLKSASDLFEERYILPSDSSLSESTTTTKNGEEDPGVLLIRKSHPTPVHDGSELMRTQIQRLIETVTKDTLTSFGLNPSSFPKLGDKKYPCHICQNCHFKTLQQLANHLRLHLPEGEEPFQCFHPNCSSKFNDSGNFLTHLKKPHMENGIFITPTPAVKRNFSNSKSKSKSNSPQTQVQVQTQVIQLKKKKKKRNSKPKSESNKSSKKKKKYSCVYCDHKFSRERSLAAHTRIHTGECPFPCPKCRSKFARTDYLKRHVESCHPDDQSMDSKSLGQENKPSTLNSVSAFPTPARCVGWPRIKEENNEDEIPEDQRIIQHPIRRTRSKHYKIRNFKSCPVTSTKREDAQCTVRCDPCNKTFQTRASLSGHVLGHIKQEEGKKPKICLLCKQQFASIESRLAHQKKAHTINNRYHCTICKTEFKSSCTLIAHLNIRH